MLKIFGLPGNTYTIILITFFSVELELNILVII